MLKKTSIKRILNLFENMDISDISIIQSAYSEKDYLTIKAIVKTKSQNINYLKAIGRLSNQYNRLLRRATIQESIILKSINSNYQKDNYKHNLSIFGNQFSFKDIGIKLDDNILTTHFKEEEINIQSIDNLVKFQQNINYYLNKYVNVYEMRFIAKYNFNIDNEIKQYISTKITSNRQTLRTFIKDLPFFIQKLLEYDDLYGFELTTIFIRYYTYKPLPKIK